MNRVRVSAASVLLLGFTAVAAQERLSLAGFQAPETESAAGWASEIEADSSTIRRQANAVFAALRGEDPNAEPSVQTVQVAANPPPDAGNPGNGSEGCIYRDSPGSRIKRLRCYYPDEGEQALNEYQFNEEIRQTRQMQAQMQMIEQLQNMNALSQ